MKYFYDCKTIEECKKKYYDLCKLHHPDKGGSVDVMKDINSQYDKFLKTEEYNSQRQQQQRAHGSHTFYGAGFQHHSKYTDMHGSEYASRFDRRATGDIFDDIPLNHQIRNYCRMLDERISNLHKHNTHLQNEVNNLSNRAEWKENYEFLQKEYARLKKKFDNLKKKTSKKSVRKKKCVTEPNAENVIAL